MISLSPAETRQDWLAAANERQSLALVNSVLPGRADLSDPPANLLIVISLDIWVPAVSALLGTSLGIVGSFGLVRYQARSASRDSRRQEAQIAYSGLISAALQFMLRTQAMGFVKYTRSGIREGLAVLFRQVQPVEPMQVFDWMNQDLQRLNDGWARVQLVGSQDAADIADDLMQACTDFIQAAMASDESRSLFKRILVGQRPSERQVQDLKEAMQRVTEARMRLVHLARSEAGREPVTFRYDRETSKRAIEPVSDSSGNL